MWRRRLLGRGMSGNFDLKMCVWGVSGSALSDIVYVVCCVWI